MTRAMTMTLTSGAPPVMLEAFARARESFGVVSRAQERFMDDGTRRLTTATFVTLAVVMSGSSCDGGAFRPTHVDAAAEVDATPDAGAPPSLRACPASELIASAACVVFTPVEAGLSSEGVNAGVDQYALQPAGAPKGALVVFLNGSLSSPRHHIADPVVNFYNAASAEGFHVLAIAYRSDGVIGSLCRNDASCFGPTRQSIVLGRAEPGAHPSLSTIRLDEGVVARIVAALRLLVAAAPGAGWDTFLRSSTSEDPADHLVWNKLVVTGHSQGGGHAAYLGKLFPVRRVVQLASTCDATDDGTPAPWTGAGSGWVTSPRDAFVGFAVATTFGPGGVVTGGDRICQHHRAVWQNMGLDPSRMLDDASECGLASSHAAPIACVENADRWRTLFE